MSLQNSTYDKIKVLYNLSRMLWFIKQHANEEIPENDPCYSLMKDLEKDLEKHVAAFKQEVCK